MSKDKAYGNFTAATSSTLLINHYSKQITSNPKENFGPTKAHLEPQLRTTISKCE